MTRNEALRQTAQENTLLDLGFTRSEAEALRRISMTLHRWHERECGDSNGCIERDKTTGKTFWLNANTGRRYHTPDRETGARKRLNRIISARNARAYVNGTPSSIIGAYIQGDPRGAALYILRPGDVPEGADASSYYTRGICVF